MKTRILFVCLGNICRSPAAEGIFLHLLKTNYPYNSEQFEVDSAGTGNYQVGNLPDHRMRKIALDHGVELKSIARTIQPKDLDYFDYIVAMDQSNFRDIQLLKDPPYKAKILLIRDFDDTHEKNVPDPYAKGSKEFEEVYLLLTKCLQGFLNKQLMTHI